MPARKISMCKLKEILRLAFEGGMGVRSHSPLLGIVAQYGNECQ